tara:strand:+ start:1872 stop:2795 length:924 start_codon:yes stop_codon:yes gene_type:complete
MFHNDWITYDYEDLTINEYPNKDFIPTTFQDALIRQAKVIYNDVKPTVFLSGGIDSQAIALGFILAELDVEYVYIRSSYCGHYNELEYFFAIQFCSKHNIDLKIIDLEFDKISLRDFLLEHDFFNTEVGSGTIFLLEGIRRHKGGTPITTNTNFIFERDGDICRGVFKFRPVFIASIEDQILFDLYYNYMFQYYEHMHRTTPEIQYLTKMESKNLIYTQLGLPFRPKLGGWEFLNESPDYSSHSVIDWSNDHSPLIREKLSKRLARGIAVIVEKLDLPKEYIDCKLEKRRSGKSLESKTLYEFKRSN